MHDGSSLRFGDFRLDRTGRALWRDEEVVPLTPKAVEVLIALVESRGHIVGKDELMDRVWPGTFVEEANLTVHVSTLRKVLGTRTDGRSWIETLPRRGYRFVADVEEGGTPALPSLAVLPFRLLDDETPAYLGVGIADMLITRLSQLGQLALRPTTSVLKYAAADTDALEAGREMKVEHVVTGTVLSAGGRVRVGVQMANVQEKAIAWAETFEETAADIFALQDKVAVHLAGTILATLSPTEKTLLARRETENVEAQHAYLEGRYFWAKLTKEALETAARSFARAIERDPRCAVAHGGLAYTYAVQGFVRALPPPEAWTRAEASARAALEHDETLADAHVALGYVRLFRDWDWGGAATALQRAVEVEPNSPPARQWYALFLELAGRFDEARVHIQRSLELDPLSLIGNGLLALHYDLTRQYDRELEQCRRMVELHPHSFVAHWALGLAFEHQGKNDEMVAAHERAVELSGGSPLMQAVLGRSYAIARRVFDGLRLYNTFKKEAGAAESLAPYTMATIHVALKDTKKALESLERAADEHDPWIVWVKVDPMLDPLRGEPRFAALVSRVVG